MRAVVLDCSVVVPWFLPEEHGPMPQKLLEEFSAGGILGVAPKLLLLEFASVALKKVRRGHCDQRRAAAQLERFQQLPIRYAESPVLVRGAYALAHELSIAVYDACYLWLASRGSIALATADDRLAEAATRIGVELYT